MAVAPEEVLKTLMKMRAADPDYNRGEVLGSMTVKPLECLVKAYEIFVDTNINDPTLFAMAYRLERESIEWLSRLFHGGGHGLLTYGGTESNLTALYVLREVTGGEVVVAPTTVHISVKKACKTLKLKLIEVPVNEDHELNVRAFCEAIERHRRRLAGAVLTVGTTDLGLIEPVEMVVRACGDDYPIHVDAAYGGIMAQVLREENPRIPTFDFSLPNVYSLAVDLHKLVAPSPCGALLLRDKALEDLLRFEAPYMPAGFQRSLLGTRCGGIAAVAWASIKLFGLDGFKQLAQDLLRRAKYLSKRLREVGLEVLREPELPIVAFKVPSRDNVLKRLWELRLFVYPSSIPDALRVVVGPHVSFKALDNLVDALTKILTELRGL